MPKNSTSGTGKKPMPSPRTKTEKDYTPKAKPRESKITLNTVPPAPSNAGAACPVNVRGYSGPVDRRKNPYTQPYNAAGGELPRDTRRDGRYFGDDSPTTQADWQTSPFSGKISNDNNTGKTYGSDSDANSRGGRY